MTLKAKKNQIKILYRFGTGSATIEKKFNDNKKVIIGSGAVVIDAKYREECETDDRIILVE